AHDRYGITALLREACIIHNPCWVRLQFGGGALAQALPYRTPPPRTLPNELLHLLDVAIGQPRRQRLDRVPLSVQQQAAHVSGSPMPALAATNRFHKIHQKL